MMYPVSKKEVIATLSKIKRLLAHVNITDGNMGNDKAAKIQRRLESARANATMLKADIDKNGLLAE